MIALLGAIWNYQNARDQRVQALKPLPACVEEPYKKWLGASERRLESNGRYGLHNVSPISRMIPETTLLDLVASTTALDPDENW